MYQLLFVGPICNFIIGKPQTATDILNNLEELETFDKKYLPNKIFNYKIIKAL